MSQATLDHPTTKAELDNFYGIEKTHRVHDEIVETITKTVRKVSHKALGVPYIKTLGTAARVVLMPLAEVVVDYTGNKLPLAALMAVMERSDCPLVAAYRAALALEYASSWADEVEEFTA